MILPSRKALSHVLVLGLRLRLVVVDHCRCTHCRYNLQRGAIDSRQGQASCPTLPFPAKQAPCEFGLNRRQVCSVAPAGFGRNVLKTKAGRGLYINDFLVGSEIAKGRENVRPVSAFRGQDLGSCGGGRRSIQTGHVGAAVQPTLGSCQRLALC